jgi:hypothetical protein
VDEDEGIGPSTPPAHPRPRPVPTRRQRGQPGGPPGIDGAGITEVDRVTELFDLRHRYPLRQR